MLQQMQLIGSSTCLSNWQNVSAFIKHVISRRASKLCSLKSPILITFFVLWGTVLLNVYLSIFIYSCWYLCTYEDYKIIFLIFKNKLCGSLSTIVFVEPPFMLTEHTMLPPEKFTSIVISVHCFCNSYHKYKIYL